MVWVPAVMSAGIVFSVATLVRDVLHRGSGALLAREARLRGGALAATTMSGSSAGSTPATTREAAPRWAFGVVGALSGALAAYLAIGATGNYFRAEGYLEQRAWVWALFIAGTASAAMISVAAWSAFGRYPVVPAHAWSMLGPTPLFGVDSHERAFAPTRWVSFAAGAGYAFLSVLATWPSKLAVIDDALTDVIDLEILHNAETAGAVFGNTLFSFGLLLVVVVAAARCRRLATSLLIAIVAGVALSNATRIVVRRPRPDELAASLDGYPSGHMVQATLLAVLVPLAVREISRRRWLERVSAAILTLGVIALGMQIVTLDRHAPTDIIGGVLLGLTVACWVRAVVTDPAAHHLCHDCVFSQGKARPHER